MADNRLPRDRTPHSSGFEPRDGATRNSGYPYGIWWIIALIIIVGIVVWGWGANRDSNRQPVASHNPAAQVPATNSPGNTGGTASSNPGTPAPAK